MATSKISIYSATMIHRYVCFVFFIPLWIKRRREAERSPLFDYFVVDLHSDLFQRLVSISRTYLGRRFTRSLTNVRSLSLLLIGPAGNGKSILARRLADRLRMNYVEVDAYSLWSDVSGTGEAKLRNYFNQAAENAPCVVVIKRVDILGKDSSTNEYDARVTACFRSLLSNEPPLSDRPMIVIGTTLHADRIPPILSSGFLYRFAVEPLHEDERKLLIEKLCDRRRATSSLSEEVFEKFSRRTSGYSIVDIERIIDSARYLAMERSMTLGSQSQTDATVDWAQLEEALALEQGKLSDVIGAPMIPDVRWEDVGGLIDVKETILESIRMYVDYPELSKLGFRRSGILLHGPPGCGKTLLAKAVATECSMNFMSVKGPELLNMYVGQSEQNIREVFERARFASPCVIFFDELDALAPNRGRSGDSGGVMDRVVSQLLAEMDGLDQRGDLFVIGATNRADLIDPSLLRPGRFDKLVYVGLGDDVGSRLSVFNAVTRKLRLSDDVDREEIVRKCPSGMSGADFYALAAEAGTSAALRKIDEISTKRKGDRGSTDEDDDEESDIEESSDLDYQVVIDRNDFTHALSRLKPSVSAKEMRYYKNSSK